jgi:predicted permease
MQPFIDTIIIVLPVFLVIALGTLLRRLHLMDDTFLQQTNKLVYVVFLPLLLFHRIGQADFNSFFNAPLVLGSSLVIVCGFLLSYGYASLRGYPGPIKGSFSQGAFRGNLAYVGLAICMNTYGENGLTSAGMLMGFLVPVLNLFAILALLLPQRHHPGATPNWGRQLALNPLIVASFLGLLWSYFKLPLPIIIDRALGISTGLSLPLALLAIGGSFSLKRIKGDLQLAGFATLIKLVLLPLLALAILVPLGVGGQDLGIGILMAGTPAATATYIMAHQMRGNAELAGSIVMLSTLLSALSYTLILLLFKGSGLLP